MLPPLVADANIALLVARAAQNGSGLDTAIDCGLQIWPLADPQTLNALIPICIPKDVM